MKKVLIGIMLVLLFALTTTVFAFGPKGGFGMGGGHPCASVQGGDLKFGPGMAANLGLTKEQIEKMRQTRETFRKDMENLRYEMFQKKAELSRLYSDPNADESLIQAKQKELSSLRQNLYDKMAQIRLEQRKILTPEQIKKLNDLGNVGMGPASRHFGPCQGGQNCIPGYKGLN